MANSFCAAFSEEPSDAEVDHSSAKKSGRARKPAKDEEENVEDEDAMSTDEKNGAARGEDEDAGDDDEDDDLEEEVYGLYMTQSRCTGH